MVDILVVLVYFMFLIVLGWAFKSSAKSTSDYFRGGGKMLWWMVGSSAFMMAISATTFTGLMGKALTGGISVIIIFFANSLGYFCNYLFFAAKARQMRIVTPLEGIRMRLGKVNEQIFTWANVPLSVLQASVWLNGLAVFTSAVIHVKISYTIVGTGAVVLLMSLVGGSWAVIASDFMQMLIMVIMTIITGIIAVWKSGGVTPLLKKGLPVHQIMGDGYHYVYLFVGWTLCIFMKQFFSTNNMVDSYRFISSKDSKNARKAALLACVLMIIGPIVWFLPAWYVAGNYPDTSTWGLEALGDKVKDATYYIFVKREMPVGMVGLILSAMFAATMSSMDSALNRNAGIILKSVYEPYFCKNKSEDHMMKVSKILTACFGISIIIMALCLSAIQQFGLFDLTMLISTLVGFPILIPSMMCFFVRKTPDWSGWGTIIVGICVSLFVVSLTPEMIEKIFRLGHHITTREFVEMKSVTLGVGGHMLITLPFFILSQFFYKEPTPERAKEINKFFYNVDREVVIEETSESIEIDNKQYDVLGKMLMTAGGFILLLLLIPNPLWGRVTFIIIAAVLEFIAFLLLRSKKKITIA